MTIPKHHWWQTRRAAAELYARECQDALVDLLQFVTSELDPEPHPWPAYFANRRHQLLASVLQRHHDDERDEVSA